MGNSPPSSSSPLKSGKNDGDGQVVKANDQKFTFFQIAEPAPKSIFLKVTNEVVEAALFFFAPFGLPRFFRDAYTHEHLFIQNYAPKFQATVESLSDAIYGEYGVTESEMAVAMHKYVEEQRDPDALEALQRMLTALQEIFSVPRVLELPAMMSAEQIEQMALQLNDIQKATAQMEPSLQPTGTQTAKLAQPECRTRGFQNMYPEVFGCLGYQLKRRTRSMGTRSSEAFSSNPAKKAQTSLRWQKMKKVLSSLVDDNLKQNHVQAFVEFYLKQNENGNGFRDHIESVSEKGFEQDSLFIFCKMLYETNDFDTLRHVQLANEKSLEGERIRGHGLLSKAIDQYEQAIRIGFGALPDCTLAAYYASLASCRLQRGSPVDDGLSRREVRLALELDPFCAVAYQVQGQLKLMSGDLKGAVRDLVLGFDLQGSGRGMEINEMANEAQMIEIASRDAVREEALSFYLDSDGSEGLPNSKKDFSPPVWLVESYLRTFSDEPNEPLKPKKPEIETPAQNICDIDEDSGVETPGANKAQELYNKGLLHKKNKEYCLALKAFQDSLATEEGFESSEDKALALNQCGTFLYLSGKMQKALDVLKASVETNPKFVNSLLKVAGLLCDMDEKEEALEWFDRALELGEFPDIFLQRGQLFLMKNEVRPAINDVKRAIRRYESLHGEDGAPAIAYATLGVAMFKTDMGSPLRLKHIEAAYSRYPENIEVLLFYGEILTQVGDFKKALEIYRSATTVSPDCPLPFVNAGRAYLALNDFGLAKAHFSRAIEIDKFCSAAYLDMGQLLLNKGEDGDALNCYQKAAQCARYLSEVQEALACKEIAEAHMLAHSFKQH